MPLPEDKPWEESWGGALELYPVSEEGELQPVPSKKVSPSWNQFIFFEVQPGKSFHSVEEVVIGGKKDKRDRLSISGWFHNAQEGEEGYQTEPADRLKSSLEQLVCFTLSFYHCFMLFRSLQPKRTPSLLTQLTFPHQFLPSFQMKISLSSPNLSHPYAQITPSLCKASETLTQVYLTAKNLSVLAERFANDCNAELHAFLKEDIATQLEKDLLELDANDQLGPSRSKRIPPHSSGVQTSSGWQLKGPPHKQRFCVIEENDSESVSPATKILHRLQNELFPSSAFRTWLALVSSVIPVQYAVEARRFRPGLDYTLATAEDSDARLDVVLGLTPDVEVSGKGKGKAEANWESGEWGGWEVSRLLISRLSS